MRETHHHRRGDAWSHPGQTRSPPSRPYRQALYRWLPGFSTPARALRGDGGTRNEEKRHCDGEEGVRCKMVAEKATRTQTGRRFIPQLNSTASTRLTWKRRGHRPFVVRAGGWVASKKNRKRKKMHDRGSLERGVPKCSGNSLQHTWLSAVAGHKRGQRGGGHRGFPPPPGSPRAATSRASISAGRSGRMSPQRHSATSHYGGAIW